jgi:hypothetical protein
VTDEIFNYEIEDMLGIKIFNEDSSITNYKITSVFNDIWKITGVNENQQVQVSIVVSSENNYMLQCNTQNVEGLQGDSVSVFYCTSMGTNVKNWIFTGELQSGLSILSNEQNFSISGIALEGGNRNFSLQYMTDYGLSPIFNFSINIKGMPQITKKIKWTVYNNDGIGGFAMSSNDWDLLYQRADRFFASGEGSASRFLNWGTSSQLSIYMPQDFFGFKVEGNFVPRKTGYYTFSCTQNKIAHTRLRRVIPLPLPLLYICIYLYFYIYTRISIRLLMFICIIVLIHILQILCLRILTLVRTILIIRPRLLLRFLSLVLALYIFTYNWV